MATEGERIRGLRDFFAESFTVSELGMFLTVNGYGEVASAVNQQAGGIEYFMAVAQALQRRGLIDVAFFEILKRERPKKWARISVLQQSWLAEDPAVPDPSGDMASIVPRKMDESVPMAPQRQMSITLVSWAIAVGQSLKERSTQLILAGIASVTLIGFVILFTQDRTDYKVIWSQNWHTITQPRGGMGSSGPPEEGGGSFTNREKFLAMLTALDLSSDPELERLRNRLADLVRTAPPHPKGEPYYDMRVTDEIDRLEDELLRGVRNRAIRYGVDVRQSRQ
jgi:hypothetical protein